MKKLPLGMIEDRNLIDRLINDPIFIQSVELDLGSVRRIYPDWLANQMVYEMLDGSTKIAKVKLSEMVKKLKDMNYMNEFMN